MQEARLASRLRHPAICPVMDAQKLNDYLVLSMPLMTGGSLAKSAGCETNEEIQQSLKSFVRLCQAIGYLHRVGWIHGDIKPENVMLDTQRSFYIVDFGSSRRRDASHTSGDDELVGTPAYLAPEIARGESGPTISTDVYSLGATLFTLLTGTLPYQGELEAILARVATGHFPSLNANGRKFPQPLQQIVAKACAAEL